MTTMPLGEARLHLSKLVRSAQSTHERFDITVNGKRSAVLLSTEDYDRMRETMAVLADPATMAAIREAEEHPDDTISLEEMKEIVRARQDV